MPGGQVVAEESFLLVVLSDADQEVKAKPLQLLREGLHPDPEVWDSSNNCSCLSDTTNATEPVRPFRKWRGVSFTEKPRASTASSTLAAFTSLTLRPPLRTRDTVARDTPARWATSMMFGLRFASPAPGPWAAVVGGPVLLVPKDVAMTPRL